MTELDRCIAEQARCAAECLRCEGDDLVGAMMGVNDWTAEEVLIRMEDVAL